MSKGAMSEFVVRAAVTVVIIRDDSSRRVLLLKRRSDDRAFSGWCLPGGRIEHEEEPSEAALRELVEETRLNGTIVSKFAIQESFSERRNRRYSIEVYLVEVASDEVVLSDEHSDYVWLTPSEALASLAIAGAATEKILKSLATDASFSVSEIETESRRSR